MMISGTNSKIKILYVDDDNADCFLFQSRIDQITSSHDYEVQTITNYDEAYTVINDNKHDIYFIDYRLGLKTGLNLIEECMGESNKGPFILLTGVDRPDLYQQSSKSGVFDYLLKNEVTPSILQRTITYTIERQKIETALTHERNLSQNIIRDVPYIVMSIDYGGFIQDVNPAFTAITQYSIDDIQYCNWVDMIAPDDIHFIRQSLDEMHSNSFRTNLICKDDSKKIIEWNILHNNDAIHTLSVVGKDITVQLENEEERRQGDKMQALGHLAGGVAHEINNLLQPIMLNAEWLPDCDEKDEIAEASQDILQNAKIASSIVEDILIFSRQDLSRLEELNFIKILNETLDVVSNMLPKTVSYKLINTNVSDNVMCMFRLKDLVRVLSNLFLNASQAMDNKGIITLTIQRLNKNSDNYVEIFVHDGGHGIPADKMETIFNPFFTTKEVGEGTGLGLTMVYNIIQNWGGHISVKSDKKNGTVFTVKLPISRN